MKRKPPRGLNRSERTHAVYRCNRMPDQRRQAPPRKSVSENSTGCGVAEYGLWKSLLSRQIRPPPRTDRRRQPFVVDSNRCDVLIKLSPVKFPDTRERQYRQFAEPAAETNPQAALGEHSLITCGWSRKPERIVSMIVKPCSDRPIRMETRHVTQIATVIVTEIHGSRVARPGFSRAGEAALRATPEPCRAAARDRDRE